MRHLLFIDSDKIRTLLASVSGFLVFFLISIVIIKIGSNQFSSQLLCGGILAGVVGIYIYRVVETGKIRAEMSETGLVYFRAGIVALAVGTALSLSLSSLATSDIAALLISCLAFFIAFVIYTARTDNIKRTEQLQQNAESGYKATEALLALGRIYGNGGGGIKKNLIESYKWYKIAATQADKSTIHEVGWYGKEAEKYSETLKGAMKYYGNEDAMSEYLRSNGVSSDVMVSTLIAELSTQHNKADKNLRKLRRRLKEQDKIETTDSDEDVIAVAAAAEVQKRLLNESIVKSLAFLEQNMSSEQKANGQRLFCEWIENHRTKLEKNIF
jgi:hypothetical protein